MRIFGELRRRNVFKVSVAYVLLSWLVVRVVHAVAVVPGPGDRLVQFTALALILGFPVVVLLAWAYEFTPHGLKPTADVDKTQSITAETGRRLNYVLLALAALTVAMLIVERLV